MSTDATDAIRSIALIGHAAAGKTTLVDALLYASGALPSPGCIDKGTTVGDFDAQEKIAGHSLYSAIVQIDHGGSAIHLIDTPGAPDFAGQTIAALAAVDTAVLVVNAQTGIGVLDERLMAQAAERGLCRMIVVNKIDAEHLDLPALLADIHQRFGAQCLLLDLPAHAAHDVVDVLAQPAGDADFASVAAAHRALIDQIVEEDESLLARYLEDGADPTPAELHAPFEQALRAGHLIPVLFVSARTGAGVGELLGVLAALAPTPAEGNPARFLHTLPDAEPAPWIVLPDPAAPVLAHVFKIVIDPYMGKIAIFRVHQGRLRKDAALFVGDARRPFKATHLYRVHGKDLVEVEQLLPGAIGAIAKVDELAFDSVLHDAPGVGQLTPAALEFPLPMVGLAVETLKKGDEQRLFDVLSRLAMEDPSFVVERHPSHNETVIRGLGDRHLKAKLDKMASQYKLELATRPPRIPYRETITQPAEGMYRHKKQSGGAGQFGEVHLRVEPLPRGAGWRFVDAVKGGVIPGVFMAAVEKGVRQGLAAGVVAGYAVDDLQITVFDGKTHAVDGKEIAFVTAARKALGEAVRAARPIVLEPIVAIEIGAPEAAVGDVSGDLAARRGHLTGTDLGARGLLLIRGEVPLAELNDYPSRLKSLTGGQGSYRLEFARYAAVPPAVQQQLASQFRPPEEDD